MTNLNPPHFDNRQRQILDLLLRRDQVSMQQFVGALYENDPNGGPDDPVKSTMVQVSKIRSKLRSYDIGIGSIRGTYGSGEGGSYRILPEHRDTIKGLIARSIDNAYRKVATKGLVFA